MKPRSCQNCDESFDRHDLLPFMFMRQGNTINCLHCLDFNYLVPNKTPSYWLVFCVATAVGLLIFSLVLDLLGLMGIHFGRIGIVSAMVGVVFLMVGGAVSIWVARFILKLWNWRNGDFSLDDNKQSALDFF